MKKFLDFKEWLSKWWFWAFIGLVLLIAISIIKAATINFKFNPDNLNAPTRKQTNSKLKTSEETLKQALKDYEKYNYKVDSCYFVIDSIYNSKRATAKDLQHWFNNY